MKYINQNEKVLHMTFPSYSPNSQQSDFYSKIINVILLNKNFSEYTKKKKNGKPLYILKFLHNLPFKKKADKIIML